MWKYFVQFYLGLLVLFGVVSILRFATRHSVIPSSDHSLRRAIYIRSVTYVVPGLTGLSLVIYYYLTPTVTLVGTAILLFFIEYAIVAVNKVFSQPEP